MQRQARAWSVGALGAVMAFLAGPALAQFPEPAEGRPVDGAINFQKAASPVMEQIENFHGFLLWVITLTTLVVMVLLFWVMIRYNKKANPIPRKFSHNTLVEVVWTVVPVLILVAIAIQSFPLLAREEIPPKAELTIKATGNKWYWSYEYPDLNVSFDSNVLKEADAAKAGKPYLLGVDEPLYVPVGTTVRVLMTSNDVIHSWAMPSMGVKQDAIPGRVNQGWFIAERPGVYYGQCSELCGIRHAYMPIEIHAVPKAEFDAWVTSKGGQVAAATPPATTTPAAPAPAAPAQPS